VNNIADKRKHRLNFVNRFGVSVIYPVFD
jgi:hypothetical protein